MVWVDVTGQGRGNLQLQADLGPCNYFRQQVADASFDRNAPAPTAPGSSAGLAGITDMVVAGNSRRDGDAAFMACMNNRHWVLRPK